MIPFPGFPLDPNSPTFPLAQHRAQAEAQTDANDEWLKMGPMALQAWVLRGPKGRDT